MEVHIMPTTLPLQLATVILILTPLSMPTADYAIASAYLSKYGFIAPSHSTFSSSLQRLNTAIIKLQAFAGLEQTGDIDRETEQVMRMRRCRVKDIQEEYQGSFERRSHGDEDSFDGKGGTLAQAFFPIYGENVHFDDEEDWTVNSFLGTSLLMSASHDWGTH